MKIEQFMDNITFAFCDQDIHPEAKSLFVDAIVNGIEVYIDIEDVPDYVEELQDQIVSSETSLLAIRNGNCVDVYYRSTSLLEFEYDIDTEAWVIYYTKETNDDIDRSSQVPLMFFFLYNTFVKLRDEYKDYVEIEVKQTDAAEPNEQHEGERTYSGLRIVKDPPADD